MPARTPSKARFLSRRLSAVLLLVVCLVVSAWSVSLPVKAAATLSPAKPPPFAAKLRPLLEAKMKQLRVPGAIVYVNVPGQGTWTTTMGIGNLATRAPMPVNSYMRIGSITKALTATAILQLVDEGKLRLDDPVGKYQPEVPNGAHITIRQLLNMTSGLFNYSDDEGFVREVFMGFDPYKVWQPKEMLAIAFKHPPYFAPGKGWHYSNTNTILLGLIIEQLTHLPAEQAFQRYIFRPLRLHESSLPPLSSSAIPDPHPKATCTGQTLRAKVRPSM